MMYKKINMLTLKDISATQYVDVHDMTSKRIFIASFKPAHTFNHMSKWKEATHFYTAYKQLSRQWKSCTQPCTTDLLSIQTCPTLYHLSWVPPLLPS